MGPCPMCPLHPAGPLHEYSIGIRTPLSRRRPRHDEYHMHTDAAMSATVCVSAPLHTPRPA
jgi:hypothetical protein